MTTKLGYTLRNYPEACSVILDLKGGQVDKIPNTTVLYHCDFKVHYSVKYTTILLWVADWRVLNFNFYYLLERGGGRGIENMGHLATNVGSEICNRIEEVNNNYIFNGSIYHKDGLQIVLHCHRTNILAQ